MRSRRSTTTVSQRAFRDVMGRFATGVAVMGSHRDGVPHGMTVNEVASVSLEPLLVLVCVQQDTVMSRVVSSSGVFALSILHGDDDGLAVHFADPYRPEGHAQFQRIPYSKATTGAPVLDACIAHVDCRVWVSHEAGDHLIVVGEVLEAGLSDDHDPLIFFAGAYRTLRPQGM